MISLVPCDDKALRDIAGGLHVKDNGDHQPCRRYVGIGKLRVLFMLSFQRQRRGQDGA